MDSKEAAMDFLPESLQVFLRIIIHGKDVDVKIAAIGQAVMQASRQKILIQCSTSSNTAWCTYA